MLPGNKKSNMVRIKNAKNPLDDSAVHPESYGIVEQMAKDKKMPLSEIIGNKEILNSIQLKHYCTDEIGLPTLQDIIKELEKPGLDLREKAKVFTFDQNIKTIITRNMDTQLE